MQQCNDIFRLDIEYAGIAAYILYDSYCASTTPSHNQNL